MAPARETGAKYDEQYKKLFAFPRMVEDLVRAFVGQLGASDFSTLRKLSSDYVSDELLKRHGDTVWRLRVPGGGWAYLLLLLEFQSRDDHYMALRILIYTGMLYQELVRNAAPEAREALPAVLPIVLYNGTPRWRAPREIGELITPVEEGLAPYQPAQRYLVIEEQHVAADEVPSDNLMGAVIGLEQSRTEADLIRVANALPERLEGSENVELRRVFIDWLTSSMEQVKPAGEELPAMDSLEEVRMMLQERLREWPAQWMREGREQGLEQGRKLGLEQGLERGLEQGLERGLERGLEQGLERGLEQGLEHERALLCRMAALRFGAETSERLAVLLANVVDPEQLADIGDRLVQCRADEEFLTQVEVLTRS